MVSAHRSKPLPREWHVQSTLEDEQAIAARLDVDGSAGQINAQTAAVLRQPLGVCIIEKREATGGALLGRVEMAHICCRGEYKKG